MPNFNLVVLAGNMAKDPELRYIPSGAAVCEFAIAINRTWKDRDGNKKEEVSFFDLVAWAKTAELIAQYFKKGKPILVQGRLVQERWETQEGQKRSKVKVVVESFQFVGGDRPGGAAPTSEEVAAVPDDIAF